MVERAECRTQQTKFMPGGKQERFVVGRTVMLRPTLMVSDVLHLLLRYPHLDNLRNNDKNGDSIRNQRKKRGSQSFYKGGVKQPLDQND